MSITWILSMISVLVRFIGQGFTPLSARKFAKNPHAIIGLLALILTFVQPIMGFLRPDPDKNERGIFNMVHKVIGYLATGLSLLAIILASTLQEAMLLQQSIYVIGSFVGFHIICHGFLRVVKQRGLTESVSSGYFFCIAGIFSYMLVFLIMIILS